MPKYGRGSKSRRWIFHFINCQDNQEQYPLKWKDRCYICIWQLEQHPTYKEEKKLIGYIHMKKRISTFGIRGRSSIIMNTFPLDNDDDYTDYIKEGSCIKGPWRYGAEPQLKASPVMDIRELMDNHINDFTKSLEDIYLLDPVTYDRNEACIKRYRKIAMKHQSDNIHEDHNWINTNVYWVKDSTVDEVTHKVQQEIRDQCAGQRCYVLDRKTSRGWWFDGYDGEDGLLIKHFKPSEANCYKFRHITSWLRCPVEVRYGHTYPLWTKVYIITKYNPTTWLSQDHPVYNGILSRINIIYEC